MRNDDICDELAAEIRRLTEESHTLKATIGMMRQVLGTVLDNTAGAVA